MLLGHCSLAQTLQFHVIFGKRPGLKEQPHQGYLQLDMGNCVTHWKLWFTCSNSAHISLPKANQMSKPDDRGVNNNLVCGQYHLEGAHREGKFFCFFVYFFVCFGGAVVTYHIRLGTI